VIQSFELVVGGSGPTALSFLEALLESGYPEHKVLHVAGSQNLETRKDLVGNPRSDFLTVLEAWRSANQSGALGKKAKSEEIMLEGHGVRTLSDAHFWGASCLPYSIFDTLSLKIGNEYWNAINKVVRSWGVHAESDSLADHYPLTGEIIGKLKRKQISQILVNSAKTTNSLKLGHSRLALGPSDLSEQSGCIGCGYCFQGCAYDVPWTPSKNLLEIYTAFPDVMSLAEDIASVSITASNHVRITTDFGSQIEATRVVLATGWKQSFQISPPDTESNGVAPVSSSNDYAKYFDQSTVIMLPLVLKHPVSESDFCETFAYHDLVVSIAPEDDLPQLLGQVYLPHAELLGRILSSFPIGSKTITRFLASNKYFIKYFGRRIGIVMVFLPGADWVASNEQTALARSRTLTALRNLFPEKQVRAMRYFGKVLDKGFSHHVGARCDLLSYARNIISACSISDISIYPQPVNVVDTSALPKIPAGPHTLSAAALARNQGIAFARHHER
jgi:hypothetical protein